MKLMTAWKRFHASRDLKSRDDHRLQKDMYPWGNRGGEVWYYVVVNGQRMTDSSSAAAPPLKLRPIWRYRNVCIIVIIIIIIIISRMYSGWGRKSTNTIRVTRRICLGWSQLKAELFQHSHHGLQRIFVCDGSNDAQSCTGVPFGVLKIKN